MIHKFVLERCVHCNLAMEDLERVGWECSGHGGAANANDGITQKQIENCSKSSFMVPDKSYTMACPHCQTVHEVPAELLGQTCKCIDCYETIVVPEAVSYSATIIPSEEEEKSRSSIKVGSSDSIYPEPVHKSYADAERASSATTEICAIFSFATGIMGFWIYPAILAPASIILSLVSGQRIKDSPNLKGTVYQVTGGLFGVASLIYFFMTMGLFDDDRKAVDQYLSNVVAGNAPYEVRGVSNYEIVDYQIEKSARGIVTAKITFKNADGDDIVQTHNFTVDNIGRVGMQSSRQMQR